MKVRKAIKKIVALGIGTAMMGATLLGATAAADLADYPSMFIDNGQFDGYMVVGDNAVSMDVVGITNIAASLQAESVQTTYVSVGTAATTSVDDGIKLDKSSEHLWLGFDLYDQETALDDTDVPNLLADGNYDESEGETDNDEDYTQEIQFTNGVGTVTFAQDDKYAEDAGWYLFFDDGSSDYMYTYYLEFDNPVEYDTTDAANDFEGTEIEMQGQLYTIVKADFDGSDKIDQLQLMAGETVLWLQQGETVTRTVDGTDHEIEMIDVTENQDSCGFKVDGSTVWVDVDETETKNGVTIGVLDAKAVYTEARDADICKVNIGASELILEDGKRVKLNGKEIDGSDVAFGNTVAGEWSDLTITYVPDDPVYLGPGESFQDPVFGNFKFVVGNVVEKTEPISFTASGNDGTLTFTNNDGKEVEIPFYTDESDVFLGDGDGVDEMVYLEGDSCQPASDDVEDCEGAMFLVVTSGGETHLMEISDIDTTDDQISFDDLTYGTEDNDNDYTDAVTTQISLGSGAGNIELTINETGEVYFNETDGGNMETLYEGYITLTQDSSNIWGVKFDEKDDETAVNGGDISFKVWYDGGSDETLKATNITANGFTWVAQGIDFSDSNDDDTYYVSEWGTEVLYDDQDKQSVEITYPEEPAYLDVYFTPIGANVLSGGSEGEVATQTVQKIAVGAVKLASEVSNIKNVNAVVVGGPCANTAAAELMGNPANCAEGFEEGHAKVKLFENNGKVQLLVAGYAAEDTRRAAIVLADYDKYSDYLMGDEVDVTGTSLTDISVGEPMQMEESTGGEGTGE